MKTIRIELRKRVSLNLAAAGLETFGGGFLTFGETRTANATDSETLAVKRLAAKGILDYKVITDDGEKSNAGKARKGGK